MDRKNSTVWLTMVGLIFVGLLPIFAVYGVGEKRAKKIVFLWTKDHCNHPNKAGCELFKQCLENSTNVKGIKCEVYDSWPENPSVLDEAATIVIYSGGVDAGIKKEGKAHPVFNSPERLEYLDKLMKKGAGMVCIHFSLYARREVEAPKLLEWIGAYYDWQGYGSRHVASFEPQRCMRVASGHPISHGWSDFALKQHELYHNLRFEQDTRAVPILTGPYFEGIQGPYNPIPILTACFDNKDYVVAWALQREDQGRGFGFGGGHFYSTLLNEDCRRMLLNAILWTAKIEVPEEGVLSSVPDKLKAGSDDTVVSEPAQK